MSDNLGVELAKEFIQQGKKINDLIDHKSYQFDVWEENGEAFVQTAICNVGGCVADYLTFRSLEEAERQAAIMTLIGDEIRTVGICSECENDEEDDIYCFGCGKELLPVYDEHPNWIKFCPSCDKRASNE